MSQAVRKLRSVPYDSRPATDAAPATTTLVSSGFDILAIGGASLLVLLLMSVALKRESPDSSIGWFVFSLSYLVNFPHFLVSYQILYADFGHKVFCEARFFWAAVIVPVLLVGILVGGFISGSPTLWGYLASSMYFFVGWHYVKQIFGGITVSNALEKFYYNRTERFALKTNLFSLWAISFLIPNIGEKSYVQDGIPYASYDLPEWTLTVAYVALAVSGLGVLYTNFAKYVREGRVPSRTAVVCFLSIYAWYLPLLSHPMFMHMIPFFHSLQYLLFVYAFRRNKVEAQIEYPNTPEGRKKRLTGLYGYLLVPAITGALLMYIIPRYLDQVSAPHSSLFGATPFYFSFLIFINIHHYFIDNVIWRGDNEEMRTYLFSSRT